jgi:hypothetical protein
MNADRRAYKRLLRCYGNRVFREASRKRYSSQPLSNKAVQRVIDDMHFVDMEQEWQLTAMGYYNV